MWQDLLTALALVLVLEGIIPFLSPDMMKRMLETVSSMDNASLRTHGLLTMIAGVVMLYFVR